MQPLFLWPTFSHNGVSFRLNGSHSCRWLASSETELQFSATLKYHRFLFYRFHRFLFSAILKYHTIRFLLLILIYRVVFCKVVYEYQQSYLKGMDKTLVNRTSDWKYNPFPKIEEYDVPWVVLAEIFFRILISGIPWNRLKDGLPAAEKCARYIVKDYSLVIKDVAEEDAGNYTIILAIPQWNLSKNLTVTLTVNGKSATCSHTAPQHVKCSISFELHFHQSCIGALWVFLLPSWTQTSYTGWKTRLCTRRWTLVFIRSVSVFHSHILAPDDLNALITTRLTWLRTVFLFCSSGDFSCYSHCRNVVFL